MDYISLLLRRVTYKEKQTSSAFNMYVYNMSLNRVKFCDLGFKRREQHKITCQTV